MALTNEILSMDEEVLRMAFEKVYMFKYNRLANENCEKARMSALEKMKSDLAHYLTELEESDLWKEMVKTGATVASAEALSHTLDAVVADQIVAASVGGAVSAATYGVQLADKMGTLLPEICALAGQSASKFIADKAKIEKYYLINGLSAGGSKIPAGGSKIPASDPPPEKAALVTGVILTAIGVGVVAGLVVQGIGKAANAIIDANKGPDSNCANINTGTVEGKVCIGTYGAGDTWYAKTYWTEYRSSDYSLGMSAGQSRFDSFQLCVWDNSNNVIKHLNQVYARDFIHIGSKGKYNYVAHCKGEAWEEQGGVVEIYCDY